MTDIISKCKISELKKIAVYLETFQSYVYTSPDVQTKNAWVKTIDNMLKQKSVEKSSEYIAQIKIIVSWLSEHSIMFKRPMKKFFKNKCKESFLHNIELNLPTIRLISIYTLKYLDFPREYMYFPEFWINFNSHPITYSNLKRGNNFDSLSIEKIAILLQTTESEVLQLKADSFIEENQRLKNRITLIQEMFFDECYKNYELQKLLDLAISMPNKNCGTILDEEATESSKALECKICLINKISIVLTTCGHSTCYQCSLQINNKCAICRTPFTNNNKLHLHIS